MQASDLYADAYSNMLVGSVKQQWEKVRLETEEQHKTLLFSLTFFFSLLSTLIPSFPIPLLPSFPPPSPPPSFLPPLPLSTQVGQSLLLSL